MKTQNLFLSLTALLLVVFCWPLDSSAVAAAIPAGMSDQKSPSIDTHSEPTGLLTAKPSSCKCTKIWKSSAKFAEVEILLGDRLNLADISALPRAPGSHLEVLDNPKRVTVQLRAGKVKTLLNDGAKVTVLREFMLVEGSKRETAKQGGSVTTLASCSGPHCYGPNDMDVDILDAGDWVYSEIVISCAPADAVVNCIDVHYEVIHSWIGDLDVDLTDEDLTCEYHLWENEGGFADNINETETGITACNGEPVNQTWRLWAQDTAPMVSGYIDHWWIKVYYYDHYIQADSYFENTADVPFDFPADPGTVYFSMSPDCGSLDPNHCDPAYDPNTNVWWATTKYNPCENECNFVTITASPTVGSDQTRTVHLDDRFHIGCGAEQELGVATCTPDPDDPTKCVPAPADVTVTVIPPEAGTAIPSSGESEYDPLSGLYEFWSTYTPNCDYAGRLRVKFSIENPWPSEDSIIIYSFEQNAETLTPSASWQQVCETFCTEGQHLNYYQVYKMALDASKSYDFSLCDNDGHGAWCDGDGDLEMFDSSGNSLWYIDGTLECGFDASTLGTAYENWSPPSDGHYYLHVSNWGLYIQPMSYCLSYRGDGPIGCSYYSPDVPKEIPDLGEITSIIEVTSVGQISDLNIRLDISHNWVADLDVFLIGPDGTQVELFTDVGADADNFSCTELDDEATLDIAQGAPPFTGRYRPEGNFSDFRGKSITGPWTLKLIDDDAFVSGTLNSWSLVIAREEDCACFPSDYSTHSDWIALDRPTCWCAPPDGSGYQCDGDANGDTETFFNYRVYGKDLGLIVANWKRKIDDCLLNPCADIDHKAETFFNYRVYGKDLAKVVENWKKKDADLPGDCPRPE